jgi:hypothetical protein
MKKRIGLLATQPQGRSKTTFVEIDTVAELQAELAKLGAKQLALHWRDRYGDGHTEGAVFPLASLADSHIAWVTSAPTGNTRSIFYDPKG